MVSNASYHFRGKHQRSSSSPPIVSSWRHVHQRMNKVVLTNCSKTTDDINDIKTNISEYTNEPKPLHISDVPKQKQKTPIVNTDGVDSVCLICQEPVSEEEGKTVNEISKCDCQYYVHAHCFIDFSKSNNNTFTCLICRNPIKALAPPRKVRRSPQQTRATQYRRTRRLSPPRARTILTPHQTEVTDMNMSCFSSLSRCFSTRRLD